MMLLPRVGMILSLVAIGSPSWAQTTQEVKVEDFIIRTEFTPSFFGPYPVTRKTASLVWQSKDGSVTYILQDDGGKLSILLEEELNGDFLCSKSVNMTAIVDDPLSYFSEDYLCSDDVIRRRSLQQEMQVAKANLELAYSRFRAASVWLHGTSTRRCLATEFHSHGPICIRYTDGSS